MTFPIFEVCDEIKRLREVGLNVLPARLSEKRPFGCWKPFLEKKSTNFFGANKADALCVVCGSTSENLEILDFDFEAILFDAFCLKATESGLFHVVERCVQERSQSGGKHLAYKLDVPPDGNKALARRDFTPENDDLTVDEIIVCGKTIKRNKTGRFVGTAIETRGAGGICLISPSPGYSVERGGWDALPTLTKEERDGLFSAAIACDELSGDASEPAQVSIPNVAASVSPRSNVSKRQDAVDVADYLRSRGIARETLLANGWTFANADAQKEYWTRPGKRDGISASLDLKTGMFFCWSTNASPIDAERTYTPLQLVAALEFNDDLSAAAIHWKKQWDEERLANEEPASISFDLSPSCVESNDDATDSGPEKRPNPKRKSESERAVVAWINLEK